MSVMIKGMEMPKDCKNCPFLCDYSCRALLFEPDWGKSGRDERCPLVPIPPHGRLIDEEALKADGFDSEGHMFISNYQIFHAPTIIEAEE